MKTRIMFLIGTMLVLIFGVIISIQYKSKIPLLIPSDDNLLDLPISVFEPSYEGDNIGDEDEMDTFSSSIPSYNELYSNAELILVVLPTGIRELKSAEILSEVKVQKVLKGDTILKQDDNIYIYEPFYINYIYMKPRLAELPNQNRIDYTGVSNIMQKDKEYVVFLKSFEYPSDYVRNREEELSYIYADRYFGQFPVSLNEYIIVDGTEQQILTYLDVMKYDCITSNVEFYDAYLKLQEEIMVHFEIH